MVQDFLRIDVIIYLFLIFDLLTGLSNVDLVLQEFLSVRVPFRILDIMVYSLWISY